MQSKFLEHILPKTMVAQVTSVLFIGILIAQLLSTWLWIEQLKSSESRRLKEVSQVMGSRIGQTLVFFNKLPNRYRHLVMDQLRDMGGTRFFVSINKQFIDLQQIDKSEFSQLVRQNLQESLLAQTGMIKDLRIQFVDFNHLRILSGNNLMVSLPLKWQRFALLEPTDSSPVVVVQLPIDKEWMYLAAVVPKGEVLFGINWLTNERLISIIAVCITVLLLTIILIRWVVSPLKLLAHQADVLGKGHKPRYLKEQGSKEMITTILAFNVMSQRIQKLIRDREHTAAVISHDLKTPLTRARLRMEQVQQSDLKANLIADLDYLDKMVKGSLQLITDGVTYENPTAINLNALLTRLVEQANVLTTPIDLKMDANLVIQGRAVAIERLFANLLDNALTYGQNVKVFAKQQNNEIQIQIIDNGPGLSQADKINIFKPYFRLEKTPNQEHMGLGMGIVRNIANVHGGELELKDNPKGGLIVVVYLPQ